MKMLSKKIFNVHLSSGTTSYLPTFISSSLKKILAAIEVTNSSMKYRKNIIHGLHIESPFFNVKKKGAHPEALIRTATDREIELIAEKGEGGG